MDSFPRLETPRLVLREIVPADVPALTSLYEDKDAMKLRGADCPETPEQVESMVSWFNRVRPATGETQFGIERRSVPGLIGVCGLRAWDFHAHQCLLGYELCPLQHGNGYMHEALMALFEWAFLSTGFNRVAALVHPQNAASLRVLRRFGFQFEGLMRQCGRWDNRYHDLMAFALLRTDFLELAAATRDGTDDRHSPSRPGTTARSAEPAPWRVAA